MQNPETDIPRPEYPRPLLMREAWLNLNGTWSFQMDADNVGMSRGWFAAGLPNPVDIVVPYAVESAASEIHDSAPADVVWYEREFVIPADWNERVMLRIGACDHWTRVFINGQEVGQHRGGYAPFGFDIGHALIDGINRITLRVEDSLSWTQPRGKQAGTTRWPIDYDSVTGIWQTIWLEPLPMVCIESTAFEYKVASAELMYTVSFSAQVDGLLEVAISDHGSVIASASAQTNARSETRLRFVIKHPQLWSPDMPHLYDVSLKLTNHQANDIDTVESYLGLREISTADGALRLNEQPLYLRGVLDQGYFPEGWYTALTDDDIRRDVELTLAMGFNCARKHQKAEDPRYLYWADKLGLLVWAEMPSGRIFSTELVEALTSEWIDLVKRDRGHPCVMAWVPFNESWGVWHQAVRPVQRAFVDGVVGLTKALDSSRCVVGNDGWEFSSGDLWTLHLYFENRDIATRLDELITDPSKSVTDEYGGHKRAGALPAAAVEGLPILLTECGGIGFGRYSDSDFSYGDIPQSEEALEQHIRKITDMIDTAGSLQGFVWTQLTDIQQEINGLLYFDRTPKLPLASINALMTAIGSKRDRSGRLNQGS